MPSPFDTHSPQRWKNKSPIAMFSASSPRFPSRRLFSRLRKLFFFLLIFGLVLFSLGVVGVLGALSYISRSLPPPEQLVQREVVESSKIFDRSGKTVLYEIHGAVKRNYVSLEELPQYVKHATIAIEDKDFYLHKGVSFKSVLSAIYEKLTRGGRLRGASTITQQLVKQAILSPERTFTRKFKEWILAMQIERKYPKDKILELYLNEIPYGSVVYGIESAAQTFFGKSAKDLTITEAATLVALPKAPTYYSPHGAHQEELFNRQRLILNLMGEQEYITPEEAQLYQNEEVEFRIKRDSILAPHFVMYVRDVLAQRYGEKFLEEGGLSIITTIDLEKQKFAEEAVQKQAKLNKEQWDASNAALVALDPKTGQILSMVGSVDFFDTANDGQVNVTLQERQPGSSFKPIVYTAAFLRGYTPDTILYDVETNFKDVCIGTPNYAPKNYTGLEYGPVTMRKALAGSLNISAVKTLYLTGIDNVIDLASRMGYSTLSTKKGWLCLSLVLGGAEVSLLDHASAFTVLAQEGIKHEISPILSIKDKEGKKLAEYEDKKTKIFDPDIARMTTSILSDNDARTFIFGGSNRLTLKNRPVAAKTGTTNDYKDAWTMGYTPSLVTGVWVGNNRGKEMKKGADGSKIAAPIWQEFMENALANTPREEFGALPENTADKAVLRGMTTQYLKVQIDKQSGKLATEFTPPRNIVEKIFHPMHNILHYVSREDPRGPFPENPPSEPQYIHWEEAVRKWAEKNSITPDDPPTEYDDIHTAENKPRLRIASPRENDTVTTRQFLVDIETESPGPIAEAEYYIDDRLIKRIDESPFDLQTILGDQVSNGFHTLRVFVYDELNNFDERSITLNFLLEPLPPQFLWKNIRSNVRLKVSSFPYTFVGQIKNVNSVKKIEVFYTDAGNSVSDPIHSAFHPEFSNYSFAWEDAPSAGTYELFVVLTDNNNLLFRSDPITAVVVP